MLTRFPFLIFAFLAYNAVVFFTAFDLEATIYQINMISGGTWKITIADLLLLLALFLLFVEILKATHTGSSSLFDHALSTILFIICLVEFLLVAKAATSTFFIITIITLIDVIAGFSITIRAARRDFAIGPDQY